MKAAITVALVAIAPWFATVAVADQKTSNAAQVTLNPKHVLSPADKERVRSRLARIHEKDQQFRSYLSFRTTDEAEIQRIRKMDAEAMMQAMSGNKRKLNPEVEAVLRQLQKKNDVENYAEFYELVRTYGYPSPKRIGVEKDELFVLLLHPPVARKEIENHMDSMSKLLLPEVRAGRMEAKFYALFIDNMRGKILRRPQLYGTNHQFDRKTGKILPPGVVSIEETNRARKELGMPALKDGEYRIVAASSK